ncbi:hypothetical protein CHUAL_011535 [Chamberlinius hualienensis]
MDSLGRRNSRQMARMRRQRSQEWREREFSSSDNEDEPPPVEGKQPPPPSAQQFRCHVVDEPRMMHDLKASLDVRGLNSDRGRLGSAGSQGGPNVENRSYAPLSGSDGDTETDDRRSPAVPSSLMHQSGPSHLSSLLSKSSSSSSPRSRMAIPLQRDPSTSSSDNNSDTTYNDSEVAIMRAGTLVMRNGSGDSPPEPAPPEVPPRGVAAHHTDLVSLRTVNNRGQADLMSLSGGGRAYGTLTKDPDHNRKQNDSITGRLASQVVSSNNQVHPSLLPAIMPVHPVRNNSVSATGSLGGHGQTSNHHLVPQQSTHPLLHSSSALNNNSTHHVHPSMHCAVPQVLPQITTSTTSPFSATHFQFRKSCAHRCTWKCLAIFLIFVTVLLTSALAYFGAVSTLTLHLESSSGGCIVVEDARLAPIEVEETTVQPSTTRVPTIYPTRVAPNNHDLWPVVEIHFGNQITQEIQPYGFWNLQLKQTQASFARFNFSLPVDGDWAIYARRHSPPTITQYDFSEIIKKGGRHNKRSVRNSDVSFLHHLDPGAWYLSIYNDNNEQYDVSFISEIASDISTRCPHNCHNRGTCTLGKCECYQGYVGNACEHSLCPVLCSSHGSYSGGVCHCERGWKGAECNIPELDCEVADCNSRGECRAGFCMCHAGFRGRHCEHVDCLDPSCSGHGVCVGNKCICRPGWSGGNCSQVDDRLVLCLPNCSGHGTFDFDSGRCVCEKYWTGSDCQEAVCSADCGLYGKCIGEQCQCLSGWTGQKCDLKLCDTRCSEHGQCNNGTCVCMQGWNGRHCTLEGCPSDCNHHGDCTTIEGEYRCQCHDGWDGVDCGVQLERACKDGVDNDQDGVTDCADSECCLNPVCQDSIMCVTTADPVDVLYRKQPPAVTASFYQRMKFLIEDNSVQSYVHKDEYSENKFWSSFIKGRVSVIRGRVVNKLGQGLRGIRVSVEKEPNFGFTLSRDQGWFDIMVNGGGSVTLRFHRSPFTPTKQTIMVPWNQIVVMENEAVMVTADDEEPPEVPSRYAIHRSECLDHDHFALKPVIHQNWRPGMQGGCPDRRVVYGETQVVQESVKIPNSDLHLVYQSSSSPGYHGTIYIQLTPEQVPTTLSVVHLKVLVEGVEFQKKFEADPNVTYTFSWNKRNVYKQKVYGLAIAKVSVGYQYFTCSHIIWNSQTATLQGYDMDISEIGGWNLDIHHRYNFQDGILQKGDGTTVYFTKQPSVVQVVMGNGEQRPLTCEDCNGPAQDGKLLAPVALASGPDGSVYIGDFNLIRRITSSGNIQTIYKMSPDQMSYHYHLVVHPVDGSLYMSSPEKGQILKLVTRDNNGEEATVADMEVVVGSGDRCVVGDHHACGDGGPAKEARLAFPKGMTISSDGTLYFADGTNVRMVTKDGVIKTLIGSYHHHRKHRKPLPCSSAVPAKEVQLLWPTEITLCPLDGALYLIDDNLVLKLTNDKQVLVVVGHPHHCQTPSATPEKSPESKLALDTIFGSIFNLAFTPLGNLLFAEVTSKNVNYVHILTPDGHVKRFAGNAPKCDCVETNCSCAPTKRTLAINTQLFAVSALTVTPDGIVYVADHGSLRILAMSPFLPKPNQLGDYDIAFPDTQDIYVFNKHGQHIVTRNIMTGRTVYSFLYSVNTSFGKLSTVTDASGNKISFLRDYSGKINTIENAQGQKYKIKISKIGLLEGIVTFSNFEITLEYHGSSGLLSGRTDSAGNAYAYHYDENGRLLEAVTPTGRAVNMVTGTSSDVAAVTVTNDGTDPYKIIVTNVPSIITQQELSSAELKTYPNGSSQMSTGWGYRSELQTGVHIGLENSHPIQAEMFFTPLRWTVASGKLSNTFEWKYGIMGDSRTPEKIIERQLWVNRTVVLTVEYDQAMLREVIYDRDRYSVLAVQYDSSGKPIQWMPSIGGLPVNILYDRFGRLSSWQWGKMCEEYTYDHQGLLTEVRFEDSAYFQYAYSDNSLPVKFTLASKREYQLHYDHQGRLKYLTLPNGGQHHFAIQLSMGFTKFLYVPPGFKTPFIQHYNDDGQLLMEIHPSGAGRILYRYNQTRLSAVVYGNSKHLYKYAEDSGMVSEIDQQTGEFEYKTEFRYDGVLLTDERHQFSSRTGLSNATFQYVYDDNFRLISYKGRIGIPEAFTANYSYDLRTGMPQSIAHFKIRQERANETSFNDGTAVFNRSRDANFREVLLVLTVDKTEVFRMEIEYDTRNRIAQVQTKLRKMGQITHSDVRSYTYDEDGQIKEVHALDTWKFDYDSNGNMISLNFKGHIIPLQYNEMDRAIRYSEMAFKVDSRGFITQRGEEHFYYDAKGHMVRATQLGRYDVWYYYDSFDRLVARKDHFGNITQFFYVNPNSPHEVTHIYNPRDGRLMWLLYDDRGFLVYVRIGAHRYYVASDLSGTPIAMFNGYGEVVREMLRSPYGHIVYDSNPFIYMPIDYQGGILDSVTQMIHLRDQVYDPLIGHWMTPNWSQLTKISFPKAFHLFRINGNDPINTKSSRWFLTDHENWLKHLGFDVKSLVPHLGARLRLHCLPLPGHSLPFQESIQVVSGTDCIVRLQEANLMQLGTAPMLSVKKEPVLQDFVPPLHMTSAPLGRGIIVSRLDRRAVIRASPEANSIIRDVITSVLNQSYFLDVHLVQHRNDVFYFVKEHVWQVTTDLDQLQRLGSLVNFTVDKLDMENVGKMDGQYVDVKIHTQGAVLGIRYGSTYEHERARVLRHAKKQAVLQRWELEKQNLNAGYSGSRDWTPAEVEQILQSGSVPGYHGEYIHDVERFIELADDPLNIVLNRIGSGNSGSGTATGIRHHSKR